MNDDLKDTLDLFEKELGNSPSANQLKKLIKLSYRSGKKLSQAMRIMGFMKNDYHIDEDLFEIFVNSGVYKKYAEDHVASNQIDQIDEKAVLGIK